MLFNVFAIQPFLCEFSRYSPIHIQFAFPTVGGGGRLAVCTTKYRHSVDVRSKPIASCIANCPFLKGWFLRNRLDAKKENSSSFCALISFHNVVQPLQNHESNCSRRTRRCMPSHVRGLLGAPRYPNLKTTRQPLSLRVPLSLQLIAVRLRVLQTA